MSKERAELRDHVHWAMTLINSVLGTCNRLLTSSSAEKNKRMVGFSFNGSLPGQPHCDDVGHLMICDHCERTRHGEMNLKDNTDQAHLRDSLVRVLGTPCIKCLKDLAGVPVKRVEYTGFYHNQNFQPTPKLMQGIFSPDFELVHRDFDWQKNFQEIFDRLAGPGGAFGNLGYRLRIIKEPLDERKV